ncbi:MAG: hypothetical protein NTW86_08545 [Candidatus Sumerlaeota bacterium]|nr:hypothetical protein [Candidatus Sumerlaeota bacterium]
MAKMHPGAVIAVLLIVVNLLSWLLFMVFFREGQFLGIPWITWSQIFLGLLAIAISIIAIFVMEKWEKGQN